MKSGYAIYILIWNKLLIWNKFFSKTFFVCRLYGCDLSRSVLMYGHNSPHFYLVIKPREIVHFGQICRHFPGRLLRLCNADRDKSRPYGYASFFCCARLSSFSGFISTNMEWLQVFAGRCVWGDLSCSAVRTLWSIDLFWA